MILACALVPAALLFGAGCGGDDGSNGVSGKDKLDLLQARAAVLEYCTVQRGGPNDLTDRSLGLFLESVRDLARVYRKHSPDEKIEIPAEKKTYTMQQLMQEEIRALRRCGRFGRQQAGVLQAVVQQEQSQS